MTFKYAYENGRAASFQKLMFGLFFQTLGL